jgi:serralysin
VYVACGDLDGDDRADVIVGAGPGGGPHVRAFSFAGGGIAEIASFYAYAPVFGGGVRVAAGDVDGDGVADIITGAGPFGGPHVRVLQASRSGPASCPISLRSREPFVSPPQT